MGDFNVKIGKRNNYEKCVQQFGFGERNERGYRLVWTLEYYKYTIYNYVLYKNTFF